MSWQDMTYNEQCSNCSSFEKKRMMHKLKNLVVLILLINFNWMLQAQTHKTPESTELWEPVPPVVTPGEGGGAPSDAIILFNGSNLDEWTGENGHEVKWTLSDGILTVKPGSGNIYTKRNFGDCQLHIEWRTPEMVSGEGQGRGNSGIFLQNLYEVQVLDSYHNRTYSNGQAGALYKQSIPLVNASKKPGEWQTYDIIFMAPRFSGSGMILIPGRITVLHNGILIQNNVEIHGTTEYIGSPRPVAHDAKGPLQLQEHGNEVSYRNIWIRELDR
jgi:hypothetical protein